MPAGALSILTQLLALAALGILFISGLAFYEAATSHRSLASGETWELDPSELRGKRRGGIIAGSIGVTLASVLVAVVTTLN